VLKRRGAELAAPIVLDLARAPGAPLYPLPDGIPFAERTSTCPSHGHRYGARLAHRKAS
jgi:hypothetical protein